MRQFLVLLFFVAAFGCDSGKKITVTPDSAPAPSQAASAPAFKAIRNADLFELKDEKGVTRKLKDFQGKVVLLHFWASWCAPCLTELPEILRFSKQFEGKPLVLLAVSLDDTWEKVATVFPKQDLPGNLISVLDPETKVSALYGSYQFPETYVINKDQQIVAKWIGPQKWQSAEYQAAIKSLF